MQIYIAEGTQQTGPFDLDTIRTGLNTGKYAPTQLAWYEGAPGWEPISKLPGMEAAAPPPPPPPSAYSPAPPPSPGSYPPAPGAYSPAPYSSAPPSPYPSAPPSPYPSAPSPQGSYSSPPNPYAPPNSYAPSSPPPKKGFWATVGGILLGLLAIVGGVIRIARPFNHSYSSSSSSSYSTPYSPSSSSTPTPTPTPAVKAMPYYNNANQFPSGERQKYYVNFHFNYPSSWEMLSGANAKNAANFVELRRVVGKYYVENCMFEDFYTSAPSLAADLPTLGPKFMVSVDANLRKNTVSYQKISEGLTKFHGYTAYEYRSQSVEKGDSGGTYTLYMRHIIVAPPSGKNGVILEMSATNSSPDVKSINDLGTKGDLATVLDSFQFM